MDLRLSTFTAAGDWSFLASIPGWQRTRNGLWNGVSTLLDNQSTLFGMWGEDTRQQVEYNMNHIAYSTNNLDAIVKGFKAHPGSLFHDGVGWDPIVNASIRTVHFYEPGRFYVTLRESSKPLSVHHIGWECIDPQSVDLAEAILQQHGFPTFWKGEIDGSYVLHFRGPDGNIHDFFAVNKEQPGISYVNNS
jgi:hypothetical protein